MDLKSSLVDTNLKIYPNEQLIKFIKTIPITKDLPHNILQLKNDEKDFRSYKDMEITIAQISRKDIENLNKLKNTFKLSKNIKVDDKKESLDDKSDKDKTDSQESNNKDDGKAYLVTTDLDWLYTYIKKKREAKENLPYLHELLDGASIVMPNNKILKRNPVLEARCVKLRAQQEAREYRKMTKGVDNVRMRFPEDSISYQLKQINRQLIAVGQFIISIFAGFLFGFRGVEWMVGNLDFGFRLLLGVMCALVIALAEIYFLAKKLNEEICVPETVQLGGPPKFAKSDSYSYRETNKEHQD